MTHARRIAVIGLGYVGLPVAVAFARSGVPVIGFDIDAGRIAELKAGHDRTREVENKELRQANLDPDRCRSCTSPSRLLHRHGADTHRRVASSGSHRHADGIAQRG